MARMRIPCFGCRTPLLFDDHDLGFTCPQCEMGYVIEHDRGVLTLVTTGERRAAPAAVVAQPAEPAVVAQPAEPVVVAKPAEPVLVAKPPSRAPLIASVLTIGMMLGLCGGIVGGLGLAAVLYATLIRPG